MLIMTVFPLFLAKSRRILITMYAVKESSPLEGSSKNNTAGSVINSYPIFTLFLSPPDTPFKKWPPILVSFFINSIILLQKK